MNKELKRAIVNFILDNDKEFQIKNYVVGKFRPYIYDQDGDYLIGGEEVLNFIYNQIKLLRNE